MTEEIRTYTFPCGDGLRYSCVKLTADNKAFSIEVAKGDRILSSKIDVSDDETCIKSCKISNNILVVEVAFIPTSNSQPKEITLNLSELDSKYSTLETSQPSIMRYQSWCGTCNNDTRR
jgi:hypothetical protein